MANVDSGQKNTIIKDEWQKLLHISNEFFWGNSNVILNHVINQVGVAIEDKI